MLDWMPVVLIASVSPHDGRLLEGALKKTGWTLLRVGDAGDAARELDGGERRAVLVIDAGLLEMAHDTQWRDLRSRHPELGTVVRCLFSRPQPIHSAGARTFEVHPDDVQGMCAAVRSLCEPGVPGA